MLSELRSKQLVWLANEKWTDEQCIPTTHSELDNAIGGGLPQQGLIEVKSLTGVGEVSFVANYLIEKQQSGHIAFINPPGLLSANTLNQLKLNLSRLVVINSCTPKEQLWALEQCLKSGLFKTVLSWIEDINLVQLRRLALACEHSSSSTLLFTRADTAPISNAKLSLSLIPHNSALKIQINKYRGKINNKDLFITTRSTWSHLYTYKRPVILTKTCNFVH